MAMLNVMPKYSAITPSEKSKQPEKKQIMIVMEVHPRTGMRPVSHNQMAQTLMAALSKIEPTPRNEMTRSGLIPEVSTRREKCETRRR